MDERLTVVRRVWIFSYK